MRAPLLDISQGCFQFAVGQLGAELVGSDIGRELWIGLPFAPHRLDGPLLVINSQVPVYLTIAACFTARRTMQGSIIDHIRSSETCSGNQLRCRSYSRMVKGAHHKIKAIVTNHTDTTASAPA